MAYIKDLNGTDHFRLWVSRNKDFGQKELVYCLNLAKSYPPKWDSIRLNNAEYIREPGNPELFNTHANAIGQKLGAEKLTERVLKVMHYGMRLENGKTMDLAEIKKKNGLTDEEWYRATQEAIWFFTDAELSAVSRGDNTEKVF
ncbi:thioester-forming surface-anchored protein [Trueperella pyogenes]|uniref:thioester-forming surface-anchored protein n=1 Tax=Trueperella pyogenes TaxID=1661 RepID=UPI00345CC4A1